MTTTNCPAADSPLTLSPLGARLHQKSAAHAPLKVTALDRLAVSAIATSTDTDGHCLLTDLHGLEVLELAKETLAYSTRQTSTRFAQGNEQRLLAALFTYREHLAPTDRWRLTTVDVKRATLTWAAEVTASFVVTEHLTRAVGLTAAPDLDLTGEGATSCQPHLAAVRETNLSTYNESRLYFPGQPGRSWAHDLDPLRSAEPFPEDLSKTALGSKLNRGTVLAGRWTS